MEQTNKQEQSIAVLCIVDKC